MLIDGPVSSVQCPCPHLIIPAVSPRDLVSCVVPQGRSGSVQCLIFYQDVNYADIMFT